jgi:cell division protein FtsZ
MLQLLEKTALNSPLLNDNDIKGAKWILVNINSTEGEFEHTMDEVEIIQNYIMEHAGEDTDVILGLGFDTGLEDKLSITLIATGFEQKNPFEKKEIIIEEPVQEKIVMTLGVTGEEVKMDKDYVTLKEVEANIEEIAKEEVMTPDLAPQLVIMEEVKPAIVLFEPVNVDAPIETIKETVVEKFVLQTEEKVEALKAKEVVTPPSSFLAKPTNIYDPNITATTLPIVQEPKVEMVKENTLVWDIEASKLQEEEAETENYTMELVIKEENEVVKEELAMKQEVEITSEKEQPQEEDELSKAAERTKKLRNLSFNFNNADADEFENQPAYLRRKNEIHNTLASVEKFYSNYTVSLDDNNEAKINTNSKNSFLEGERPD